MFLKNFMAKAKKVSKSLHDAAQDLRKKGTAKRQKTIDAGYLASRPNNPKKIKKSK
ncbi:MAG: hypothetical protein ABI405_04945 [Parafilimonas sp.]